MTREYFIEACTGQTIQVRKNSTISMIDVKGRQVVDFFAEAQNNPGEFLSTGVTMTAMNR